MSGEPRLQFIYQFRPGIDPSSRPTPGAWTPEDELIGQEHCDRLSNATEEGVVILAGRSPDGVGPAVVIFEADSEEAARRFMEEDPFVKHGLFGAELHAFRIALMRQPGD